MQGRAAVVGVGESAYYVRGKSPDSEFQLACTAIVNAAADAGVRCRACPSGVVFWCCYVQTSGAW